MNDVRKNPLWPWIVALLIGLPVTYVASFGPACGMWTYDWISDDTFILAYGPLVGSLYRCPWTVRVWFIHWAAFCGASDIQVYFLMHSKADV